MDIICNMDGTLADNKHRLYLIDDKTNQKWDEFFLAAADDTPIGVTIDIIQQLMRDANRVIFVTGRPERIRDLTLKWMARAFDEEFDPQYILLMMRRDDDHRDDVVVKEEMLIAMRQLGFKPEAAFEDRKRVAQMYRREGIVVYQVAEGDY